MDNSIMTEKYPVRARDADALGRLKIASAQLIMQEISEDHCRILGYSRDRLVEQDVVWLLSRSRVEFESTPVMHDDMSVTTWPLRSARSIYPRCYIFSVGGKVIGKAITQWLLVNLKTRAMVDGEKLGIILPETNLPQVLKSPARLRPEGDPSEVFTRTVRYSDLDLNGHMNNARYAEWLLDAVDAKLLLTHEIRALQLNYLHEVLPGNTVTLSRYDTPDGYLLTGACGDRALFEGSVILSDRN